MKTKETLKAKSLIVRILFMVVLILGVMLIKSQAQSIQVQDRAMIRPSIIHLEPGEKQRFKIVLKATRLNPTRNPEGIIWSVNDIEGGNQEYGVISKEGVYYVPDKMPHPREIHIGGYTEEAQNKQLYATVIIGKAPLQYKSVKIWSKPLNDEVLKIKSPHGFGLDKDGNILMADESADRVYRFSPDGKYLNDIGKGQGESPGEFKWPREVRCSPEGEIYVSDSKGDDPRIQVFSHGGELLHTFADKGRGPSQILRAHGFGFGPDQTVSIVDVDNMRVKTYKRPIGEFLYDFGSWNAYKGMNPGEMNACHGIFVDQNGDVFVNSYYGPTHKFTPRGESLAEFCHGNPPEGSVYFHNLTGDKWGNVYVMARPEGGAEQARLDGGPEHPISVIKFNNNGDFVTEWSYSDSKHRETTAAVDDNGVYYGMYVTENEMVIEIFNEE
ncbi:hypothetical protein [Maribellus sediminis]|uniref:hypothetical protein n=1 Tax=Maribellus sediminis TaxID=2696285 RepID=UPI0014316CE6|nr:hypothetical protein [Maribellus sediminis]